MNKKLITSCIAFAIIGLPIDIGIFLYVFILTDLMRSDIWRIAGFLIGGMFILTAYSVICNDLVCRMLCAKNKLIEDSAKSEYRIEKYVIRRWKQPSQAESRPKTNVLKNKRGRRSPTPLEDKIRVIKTWDNINRRLDPVTLEEFLASEFGTSGEKLNISKRTFYNWRSKFGHLINPEQTDASEREE